MPLFCAVHARPSGDDTSVPPEPAAITNPGRAATARKPTFGIPLAARHTRPSALDRIVPASPTTIQRFPVHTAPRSAWLTGVRRTTHRDGVDDVAINPSDPTATTREPFASTFARVSPPPGARAQRAATALPTATERAPATSVFDPATTRPAAMTAAAPTAIFAPANVTVPRC